MTGRSPLVGLLLVLALAGCTSGDPPVAEPPLPPSPTFSTTPTTPAATSEPPTTAPPTSSTPEVGTVPPPWLGTRPLPLRPDGYGQAQPTPPELDPRRFTLPDTLAPLPGDGFASVVEKVPAEVLGRSTWAAGCPVGADDLAYVQLTFWGFDDQRHTGELLLNRVGRGRRGRRVPDALRGAVPLRGAPGDPALGARRAPDRRRQQHRVLRLPAEAPDRPRRSASTPSAWPSISTRSRTPTRTDDLVLPELASSYLDRDDVRPGMITPDGVVVRAFELIGWTWGGTWRSLKDYQHFSQNGR